MAKPKPKPKPRPKPIPKSVLISKLNKYIKPSTLRAAVTATGVLAFAAGTGIATSLYQRKNNYGTEPRVLEYDSKNSTPVPLEIIKQKMNSIKRIECKERIKLTIDSKELNMYISGICDVKTAVVTSNLGISTNDHKGWCAFAHQIYKENLEKFKEAIQKNKRLYIIGTSMGAAITAYVVSFLLDLYKELNKKIKVMGICASSPRCLNSTRNARVHKYIFSIVNMLDLVTYLPLGSMVLPGRIIAVKEENKDVSFKVYENDASYSVARKEFVKRINVPVFGKYHSLSTLYIKLAILPPSQKTLFSRIVSYFHA